MHPVLIIISDPQGLAIAGIDPQHPPDYIVLLVHHHILLIHGLDAMDHLAGIFIILVLHKLLHILYGNEQPVIAFVIVNSHIV